MENYSHFLLQKVSGRLLVVAYLCLAGSFKGSLGMWNWRSCASFCLSEESLHIPFLQLLTTWPLQELCNPSLPSLQESQPEILAPFMRQALFCVVYRCCRQFWDVKCCKPHFLVILQKYFTEVRFVHGDLLGLRSQTSAWQGHPKPHHMQLTVSALTTLPQQAHTALATTQLQPWEQQSP